MSEQEERLNALRELAMYYAKYSLEESTDHGPPEVIKKLDLGHGMRRSELLKKSAAKLANANAIEAVFFCQEIVSRCPNIHMASMWLTILTNRMLDSVGR